MLHLVHLPEEETISLALEILPLMFTAESIEDLFIDIH